MTLLDAYITARSVNQKKGFTLLLSCEDFGDFWGFDFGLPNYDEDDPTTWMIGRGPTTVNKKSGAVVEIGSGQVPDLPKGKAVPLKLLKDYIPPTAKTAKRRKPTAVAV